jgi:hypothetical protein
MTCSGRCRPIRSIGSTSRVRPLAIVKVSRQDPNQIVRPQSQHTVLQPPGQHPGLTKLLVVVCPPVQGFGWWFHGVASLHNAITLDNSSAAHDQRSICNVTVCCPFSAPTGPCRPPSDAAPRRSVGERTDGGNPSKKHSHMYLHACSHVSCVA